MKHTRRKSVAGGVAPVRAPALVLDHADLAVAYALVWEVVRSFARDWKLTGRALVAAVKAENAHEKEQPVTEAEMALYLKMDAAFRRKLKRAT